MIVIERKENLKPFRDILIGETFRLTNGKCVYMKIPVNFCFGNENFYNAISLEDAFYFSFDRETEVEIVKGKFIEE